MPNEYNIRSWMVLSLIIDGTCDIIYDERDRKLFFIISDQ